MICQGLTAAPPQAMSDDLHSHQACLLSDQAQLSQTDVWCGVMQVGLGTDVAGGYSPSMLNAMRSCVVASRSLCMQHYAAMAPPAQTPSYSASHSSMDSDQPRQPSAAKLMQTTNDLYIAPAELRKQVQSADLLDWKGAFWLATVGGAQALGLEATCGTLEVGKAFDALRVDTRNAAAFDVFPADSPMDAFQKFVNLGDDRNVKAVWVGGKLVHEKKPC